MKSSASLSLFFFLIADWGSVEFIFPFISAHPLGPVLNSSHTWAAQESTYGTNQPAFLIVLLPKLNLPSQLSVLELLGLRPGSVSAEHGQSFGRSQTLLSIDWMELTRCGGWGLPQTWKEEK